MTRALFVAVALSVAGCSGDDCSFPGFPDVDVVPLSVAARPAADSVVVALVPVGGAGRGLDAAVDGGFFDLRVSPDDSVRVRLELAAEAGVRQRASAAVVGDTVWVRVGPAALVRPACSPPLLPGEVGRLRVDVPEGVAVRAVVVVPPGAAPDVRPPPRPGGAVVRA